MDLALFDLDETLISEDSTGLWLRWLVSQGFASSELIEEEQALMRKYYAGTLSIEDYMHKTLSPLSGMATLTVEGWIRRFIHRDIMPRVYPEARERLKWHQSRGDRIIVISASGEHLVTPIARQLGACGALAIGVEVVDERYSGNTYGTMTFQQGKVTRVEEWKAQRPDEHYSHTWAYSDSLNDLPMLVQADYAHVINPAEPLRQEAEKRGWPVYHWAR
ncbi:HAD family hydrolase [Pantoea sp. CS_6]|uniref:HAD family hydrolase n=1 Tax=Pantoea sp. CS_6 TaxID=3055795 RepID=UPI0035BEC039